MACRGCVASKCVFEVCQCVSWPPRGTRHAPMRLHAPGHAPCADAAARRRGARSRRWLRGGDVQRGARLALAMRRGCAEGREAGAGHAEGLRRGARGWRWPHTVTGSIRPLQQPATPTFATRVPRDCNLIDGGSVPENVLAGSGGTTEWCVRGQRPSGWHDRSVGCVRSQEGACTASDP